MNKLEGHLSSVSLGTLKLFQPTGKETGLFIGYLSFLIDYFKNVSRICFD